MKRFSVQWLLAASAVVLATVAAEGQRLKINPPATQEAPPILRARGDLTPPQERAPSDELGFFVRSGVDGAADGFGKAYKKKIDKIQITGPIELSVDRLSAGPDRYIEILGADSVVPGAAKIPCLNVPNPTKVVRLHFKPFKANSAHLLTFHLENFHKSNSLTFVFEGSGVKFQAKSTKDPHVGFIVVPGDTSPLTITVSANGGYWWRFYGVEVSMLNN